MMKCQDVTGRNSCSHSNQGRTRRKRRRRTRCQSLQSVSCAAAAVHISLAKWMKSNTNDKKWKCQLAPAIFHGSGRGLQTKCNLKSGDLIISIPQNLLITVDTVLDSEVGFFLKQFHMKMTPQEIISLFLLSEEQKRQRSSWNSYIATLPTSFSTPTYFSLDELSLLPPGLYKKSCERMHRLRGELFLKVKTFFEYYMRGTGRRVKVEYENFLWAWYCINSRSVYYKSEQSDYVINDGNHIALAPFLDLLNHSCEAKVEAGFNNKTNCYEIRTYNTYRKYDEVFISYGPHDNCHLLLEYGFTLPNNPHDVYELDYEKAFSALSSLKIENLGYKVKIIQESQLRKLICSTDGLSYEFWVFLRIFAMDWSEMRDWRHVYKGEEISMSNTKLSKQYARHLLQPCITENTKLLLKFPKLDEMTHHQKLIHTVVMSEHNILQAAWKEVN